MYKHAVNSNKNAKNASEIINELGAVTMEQHAEFAKLTGRFDASFKVGKTSEYGIGKTAFFKVGKASVATSVAL